MVDQPETIGSEPKEVTIDVNASIGNLIKAITTQLETHSLEGFLLWLEETLTMKELAKLVQYFIVMNRSRKELRGAATIDPRKKTK